MRSHKADASTVRVVNRTFILNLLRQEGTLSRVQLKDLTGLSGAAITSVVTDLIEDGIVIETAAGPSSGGRPPMFLTINYQAKAAIGIKLMETSLTAVLTDAGANIEQTAQLELPGTDPQTVVDHVEQVVKTLLEQSHRPISQVLGIGIGMAGLIDHHLGVYVASPYLKWDNVPIASLLEERLQLPVVIDNDVNAFAAAERLFGQAMNAQHILVVTVGRGIGAGIVVGGQTYRGFSGSAGEIGHMVSEPGGRICDCGKRGCVEAYSSDVSLLARYRELRPQVQSLEELKQAATKKEPIAVALMEDGAGASGLP